MPATLVIGIGGVGSHTCRRLYERLGGILAPGASGPPGVWGEGGAPDLPELLTLDTDRTAVPAPGAAGGVPSVLLTTTTAVLDAAYRAPERFHGEWLNREILRGRT